MSSKEITFQVLLINIRKLEFMFTLTEFVTESIELVNSCVMETWSDKTTDKFIHKLANKAPTKSKQQDRLNEIIFLEWCGSTCWKSREKGDRQTHTSIFMWTGSH